MTIRLAYVSDIHLEFRSIDQVPKLLKNVNADILILAGDIVPASVEEDFQKFLVFLGYYCKKYKYIIHVSGNHEYYTNHKPKTKDNCMTSIDVKLKNLTKTYNNYLYLNCNSITLSLNEKTYVFAGATLWTYIKPEDYTSVEKYMNDYSSIYVCDKENKVSKFSVVEMQMLHKKHCAYMKKVIKQAEANKLPLIIINHHKPVLENTKPSKLNQAYMVDMSKIYKSPYLKLCISGHTHVYMDKDIEGVRYVSNPKGYPSQRTNFKPDMFIEL